MICDPEFESKHSRPYRIAVHFAFGAGMAALLVLVLGYFVMLLWNGVLTYATAARPISYWQSVGMLVLARILVGGFHGRGNKHKSGGGLYGHRTWREYDRWWQEVGKQSFENFSGAPERADKG